MNGDDYYITKDGRGFKSENEAAHALENELIEAREKYETLASLLNKRFPKRNAIWPDCKVEDVLKENDEFRSVAACFAQHNDRIDSNPAELIMKALRRRDDDAQRLRREITDLKSENESMRSELRKLKP